MKDWHIYKKWYFWVIVLIVTIFESPSYDILIFLAYFIGNFVFVSLIWGVIFLIYLIFKNLRDLVLKKPKSENR